MKVLNPWVSYVDRSYEQIKRSLVSRLVSNNPEITDHTENNILIIIISMFAGIGEQLNYYIDNMAREAFLETARKYTSVVRLTRMLDYRIKAKSPAYVDITLTLLNGVDPIAAQSNIFVPAGIVVTNGQYNFVVTSDHFIRAGSQTTQLFARQIDTFVDIVVGTSTGAPNQQYTLGENYAQGTARITINNQTWELVSTLGFSRPTSRHFIIDIEVDGQAYIKFGDGLFGAIPEANYDIYCTFDVTVGSEANNVLPNAITQVSFVPPAFGSIIAGLGYADGFRVTNLLSPAGGTDYEGIEQIRQRAPLSLRTLDRAVTPQDYQDIALTINSVFRAKVGFCCGKSIDIYIAPFGESIASSSLLNQIQDYFDCRKMVTTFVKPQPAGITYFDLTMQVTPKFFANPAIVNQKIIDALNTIYSYPNSDINKPIFFSYIYRALAPINEIDTVAITMLRTRPYARPFNHTARLFGTILTLPGSGAKTKWKVVYQNSVFTLFREQQFITNLSINQPFITNLNEVQITITPGIYSEGMQWDFVVYPYTQDISLDDFTVPVINPSTLTILLNPASDLNTCNTTCA
jgi:hypothetical protein